jgi:SAM-dependent methyltransferase
MLDQGTRPGETRPARVVAHTYSERFFSAQRNGSESSAKAILPRILAAVRPNSVIDVGCGAGTWLAATGVDDVLGLDGSWVPRDALEIPAARFRPTDLRESLQLDRRFDLAICLETAEHLPVSRSSGLVSDLVQLAPVVLFSAAVPGQGGTDHVNEQPPGFWADLFSAHSYRRVDAIRWEHWDDERVEWWYAQNAFLYVAHGRHFSLPAPTGVSMNVVHPAFLAGRLQPQSIPPTVAISALAKRARRATRDVMGH